MFFLKNMFYFTDRINHRFPKWAVPPPPRRAVGLPRGALEVGPSERVVRLFTIDQARA
jgi:hypothetical protein